MRPAATTPPVGAVRAAPRSTAAGHPDGYPVSVTLEWVGESRIRPPGAAWFTWTPIANTLTETGEDGYPVVEVRSALSG